MSGNLKIKQGYYELYLMDKNHIKRLFIISTQDKKKLDKMTNLINKSFDLNLEKYNPVTRR